jgi:hypothetical protein
LLVKARYDLPDITPIDPVKPIPSAEAIHITSQGDPDRIENCRLAAAILGNKHGQCLVK